MNGGERIAHVLHKQGVRRLYTLCGGHISPILVGARKLGLDVIDVRHEANAVFAADAEARLTGIPGVAAVTAGPGCTNTITAVKNAQLAQSPVVILGGATATVLRGRGALQDIDQMALFKPHTKWATRVTAVRQLIPTLLKAFHTAAEGVPGPVFVECPVDLLYDEETVRGFYGAKSAGDTKNLPELLLQSYLKIQLMRVFAGLKPDDVTNIDRLDIPPPTGGTRQIPSLLEKLRSAQRPVMLLGSQATLHVPQIRSLVAAVEKLGIPVFLSGMARGLLGRQHELWFRHQRTKALKEADLVILAGVPCDFRLNYGLNIGRKAHLVSINRSPVDVRKNRRPNTAIVADPASFLMQLADESGPPKNTWADWLERLRERDAQREAEIGTQASEASDLLNPLQVCKAIESALDEDSVIVADGGDFVATASYILAPRSPLSWLDPGVFGTLGVGAGFAMAARRARPDSEVWIIYGDGSVGFSIAEFDSFVRHGIPVIAVVGNDGCWTQIARDQVVILEDDVGTNLARSDYHRVAEGFGAKGFVVIRPEDLADTLQQAKQTARQGIPVLVNLHLGKTEFRKGSVSM